VSDRRYEFLVWGDTLADLQSKAVEHCEAFFGDVPFRFDIHAEATHLATGAIAYIEAKVYAIERDA
jgi:hypothetical protein